MQVRRPDPQRATLTQSLPSGPLTARGPDGKLLLYRNKGDTK